MKIFAILISIFLMFSCAKKKDEETVTLTTKNYVYYTVNIVGSAGKIIVYEIDTKTGVLTEVEQVDALINPKDVAITSDGKFLYVVNFTGIQVFSIAASTGKLTSVEEITGSLSDLNNARISPDDKFLYFETESSGVSTMNVYSINATTGALTSVQTQSLGFTMFDWIMDSDGTSMYFSGYQQASSNSSVLYYATRSATSGEISLSTLHAAPNNATFSTAVGLHNSQLYIANVESSFGRIGRTKIKTDGTLDVLDTSNNTFNYGSKLIFHPTLDILYTNIGSGTTGIQPFTVGSDGELTIGTLVADSTANTSWGLEITKDAAAMVSSHSSGISTFTIDSAGALTKVDNTIDISTLGSTVNGTGVGVIQVQF